MHCSSQRRSIDLRVLLIAVFTSVPCAHACTAFCLNRGGAIIAAKNYAYGFGDGLVIVNKKNTAKRALLMDPNDKPAEWVSKYGSVTFNQYGREIPIGGMNEAGLVVETLMLNSTRYPARDARSAVTAWVQYQLDVCETVAQVIESDKTVRMHYAMPMPVHFFVCDRQGQAAVVEFINGRLVCHSGQELPFTAITNDTYETSSRFIQRFAGYGGNDPIPANDFGSLQRFVVAADRVAHCSADTPAATVEYAFETLKQTRQGDITQWSIVYDTKNLEIHYRTPRWPVIKTIQFAGLDFGCGTPVKVISINTTRTGVLNPFLYDYDPDLNRWLVGYAVRRTPELKGMPDAAIDQLAAYPESTSCK
jgi:penicillin V acylase-like amidase (Ntn superfamily)